MRTICHNLGRNGWSCTCTPAYKKLSLFYTTQAGNSPFKDDTKQALTPVCLDLNFLVYSTCTVRTIKHYETCNKQLGKDWGSIVLSTISLGKKGYCCPLVWIIAKSPYLETCCTILDSFAFFERAPDIGFQSLKTLPPPNCFFSRISQSF